MKYLAGFILLLFLVGYNQPPRIVKRTLLYSCIDERGLTSVVYTKPVDYGSGIDTFAMDYLTHYETLILFSKY